VRIATRSTPANDLLRSTAWLSLSAPLPRLQHAAARRCGRHGFGYAGNSIQELPMNDMPDFSNVNSGSSSTAEKIYEVKSGDSLSKIAKNEYGDANKWRQIFEANQDILKDPNKIFPGQKLKIPPLS
jgi:nucleoid-associated protein YgaU